MSRATRPALGEPPDAAEELRLQQTGRKLVAGVDEAGRGAWAGPLVAGAVILADLSDGVPLALRGMHDSKRVPPSRRLALYGMLLACAEGIGVGSVSAAEVDLLGLSRAGQLAMIRAVRALALRPDHLLVDAFRLPACPIAQTAIVHGDARCVSIAAASIVAKVVRDRWMCDIDRQYPEYGLAQHKGYGAPRHRQALERVGPSPIHRHSYAPVAELGRAADR